MCHIFSYFQALAKPQIKNTMDNRKIMFHKRLVKEALNNSYALLKIYHMSGTVLNSLNSLSYLTNTGKKNHTSMKYYDPILCIGKLKLREVGKLAHGHTTSCMKS